MNLPEYDGSPTSRDAKKLASSPETTNTEVAPDATADHSGSTDEQEARAREQRKAVEEEAIEAEHLDYFLAHVSATEH